MIRKSVIWMIWALLFVCSADMAGCTSLNASEKDHKYEIIFVELGSVKCIPCRMMQPVMERLERNFTGKVKVVFHDVWTKEGKPYAKQYRIRAIPTQVFLDRDGKEIYRHTGFLPYEEILKLLKRLSVEPVQ